MRREGRVLGAEKGKVIEQEKKTKNPKKVL